jgi:hypothetical protein
LNWYRLKNAVISAAVLLAIGLFAQRLVVAQTTQPADGPTVEQRAQSAFNRGDWVTAVPLLKELKEKYASISPDRVGAIEEQIRLAERALATGAPPPVEVPTAAETRKPHSKPAGDSVYETTIKELGNFDYDQNEGGNIPADVKALAGSKIRLKGFMIPMDQAESITTFALVPDLFACCFGQPPQIQHTLVAKTPQGKAVSYYPDEIVVEGTLRVEEKKEDGFLISVFEVDVSSVRPSAR